MRQLLIYIITTTLLSHGTLGQAPVFAWTARDAPTEKVVKARHGSVDLKLNERVFHQAGTPNTFRFDGDGKNAGAILLGQQEVVKQLPKQDISIEAWVKIKQPLAWGGILSTVEDNGSYERGFILGYNKETFYWAVAGNGTNPLRLSYLNSSHIWIPNEWYHVVATFDGKKQVIYIDGEASATSAVQRGSIQYAEEFFFSMGAYWDKTEKYAGKLEIESLAVWDRALSAEVISQRFKTRKVDFPGILGTNSGVELHKDWPSYQRDKNHSAHYPHDTEQAYHLQWSYETAKPPAQAWPGTAQSDWWRKRGTPEPEKNTFDKAFQLVAAKGKVYFGSSSEDHVYCLDQSTGNLLWKCAAEGPVRLAPTIHEDRLYFGSDDGYVYCLNAGDGKLRWRTCLPQVKQRRLAGNGRMISLYPIRTNIFIQGNKAHFGCGLFPKNAGAWYASIDIESGKVLEQKPISSSPQGYLEERNGKLFTPTGRHPAGAFLADLQKRGKIKSLKAIKIPQEYRYAFIRSNSHHIGGGRDKVALLDSSNANEEWTAEVKGIARSLALSQDQLLVSTDAGMIYCFGKEPKTDPSHWRRSGIERKVANDPDVARVLSQLPSRKGYALVPTASDPEFLYQLARQSELQIIALSTEVEDAEKSREWLWDHGLYGQVVVHQLGQDPASLNYSKRSFNLITASSAISDDARWKSLVRPGTGIIMSKQEQEPSYRAKDIQGSGSWTHMYANAGNTACSDDQLVGSQLALQWYGRPGPQHIIDRHLRPPPALVFQGVMAVPGRNYVLGVDAWNGTILWEKSLENFQRIGAYRDSGNMVMREDYLYCATGSHCKVLGLHTGQEKTRISLPGSEQSYEWGYLASLGSGIVGSAVKKGSVARETSFAAIYSSAYGDKTKVTCSDLLFANHRHTGKSIWIYRPEGSIINPTIALNQNSAVFIESSNQETLRAKTARLDFPDLVEKQGARLTSVNIASGKVKWRMPIAGCQDIQTMHLVCTGEYVVLVYSHNLNKRMHYTTQVFGATNGKLLWEDTQGTRHTPNKDHGEQDLHPALIGNQLIAEPHIYDIATGKVLGKFDRRGRGCGTISASSRSLYYRAGNLASYDIAQKKAGQITSVSRPGCWINMIPASGLLLVPEGSSGCICKFAIQSSMGFVPVDE